MNRNEDCGHLNHDSDENESQGYQNFLTISDNKFPVTSTELPAPTFQYKKEKCHTQKQNQNKSLSNAQVPKYVTKRPTLITSQPNLNNIRCPNPVNSQPNPNNITQSNPSQQETKTDVMLVNILKELKYLRREVQDLKNMQRKQNEIPQLNRIDLKLPCETVEAFQ